MLYIYIYSFLYLLYSFFYITHSIFEFVLQKIIFCGPGPGPEDLASGVARAWGLYNPGSSQPPSSCAPEMGPVLSTGSSRSVRRSREIEQTEQHRADSE